MKSTANLSLFILIFLWIFLLHSPVLTFDSEGVTVVHLIDDISSREGLESPVITEIHLRSKALGKLLLDAKGEIIHPVHNLPMTNILHSERNISFIGSWSNGTVSFRNLENIKITTKALLSQIYDSEGGDKSDWNDSHRLSSCPDGYTMQPFDNSAQCVKRDGSCNYFLSAIPSGQFATPNYPRSYGNNIRCSWVISAPPGHTIQLYIPDMVTEFDADFLYVYDISEGTEELLGKWSGSTKHQAVVSNGNLLKVVFVSDEWVTDIGGEVLYSITESAINLEEDKASIILEQLSFKSEVCLSVIYKLLNLGTIAIYVMNNEEDNIILQEINRHEESGWNISRFVLPEYLNFPIDIYVNMTGKGSVLYSIVECDGTDVDIYSNKDGADFGLEIRTTEDLRLRNMQLGLFSSRGPACGKNHYGPDCKEKCSGFQNGCKKMIFCNYLGYPFGLFSCSCASGFKGWNCNEVCPVGLYGANCVLSCGHCKSGSCNPYIGKCTGECKDGYHFPYCQERLLYMKYAPTASIVSTNNVTINVSFNELFGEGSPYLFQVQYKEEFGEWNELQPDEILLNSTSHINVPKLKSGTKYFLRIIIICNDGNSYQGDEIPLLEITTNCIPHNEEDYEINVTDITSSSFSLKWKKKIGNIEDSSIPTANTKEIGDLNKESYKEACPEIEYRVTLHDRWRRFLKIVSPHGSSLEVTFENLLPGHQYKVHLCAVGITGVQFCSSPRTLFTARTDKEEVNSLQAYSLQGGSLNVTWSISSGQRSDIAFKVHYQCMKLLLCEETCNESRGVLETPSTFIELHDLVPLAQYRIWLSAFSPSEIFATTLSAKPTTAPRSVQEPLLFISNTTATVAWDSANCYGLNGNLRGYFYRLAEINPGTEHKTVKTGNIQEQRTTLHNLTPQTNYTFDVYLVNSHGWNPDYKLSINFTTPGTVPEAVEELVVYKKGRRMLSFRWASPARVYGTLKSFKFAYRDEVSKKLKSETLNPTPCLSWPNFYCHTVNNLRPDRNYTIFVSARNEEIEEDGQVSVIQGYTRENAPGAPMYLNISESTSNSLVLHWGVPMLINGELRSFLVNVEHIDSLNDDTCCEYFPVYEVPVNEESPSYSLKVTNLSPTSTYIISVTAKTITLGPSINMTHKTPPAPPAGISPPQLIRAGDDNRSYRVKIQPINELGSIDCTYLVLVLNNNDRMPVSIIPNVALKEKLDAIINHRFYITSEFSKDELLDEQEIIIGTGGHDVTGETGIMMNPKLDSGIYEVALVAVLKYGESFSIGFATSDAFEIK